MTARKGKSEKSPAGGAKERERRLRQLGQAVRAHHKTFRDKKLPGRVRRKKLSDLELSIQDHTNAIRNNVPFGWECP